MIDNRERAIEITESLKRSADVSGGKVWRIYKNIAIHQAEQKLDLLDALKAVEWSDDGRCPQCETWNFGNFASHQPECVVGLAIAKAERKG